MDKERRRRSRSVHACQLEREQVLAEHEQEPRFSVTPPRVRAGTRRNGGGRRRIAVRDESNGGASGARAPYRWKFNGAPVSLPYKFEEEE